jgi:hypothetical protein
LKLCNATKAERNYRNSFTIPHAPAALDSAPPGTAATAASPGPRGPRAVAVLALQQMRQLVHDDVLDAPQLRPSQLRAEPAVPGGDAAAAPLGLHLLDALPETTKAPSRTDSIAPDRPRNVRGLKRDKYLIEDICPF